MDDILKLRMKKLIAALLVGFMGSFSVPAQTNPVDLPPSPFSLPASTEPQSASFLRDAGRVLELHAATTNAAARKLLVEIRDMKQKLSGLEADAWRKDPLLLTCDRYIEKAHDWVMEKHRPEMKAEARYFFGSTNQPEAGQRLKLENNLAKMLDLILL